MSDESIRAAMRWLAKGVIKITDRHWLRDAKQSCYVQSFKKKQD